jgi:hypothetical protein
VGVDEESMEGQELPDEMRDLSLPGMCHLEVIEPRPRAGQTRQGGFTHETQLCVEICLLLSVCECVPVTLLAVLLCGTQRTRPYQALRTRGFVQATFCRFSSTGIANAMPEARSALSAQVERATIVSLTSTTSKPRGLGTKNPYCVHA